jgi:hypothetical protein
MSSIPLPQYDQWQASFNAQKRQELLDEDTAAVLAILVLSRWKSDGPSSRFRDDR